MPWFCPGTRLRVRMGMRREEQQEGAVQGVRAAGRGVMRGRSRMRGARVMTAAAAAVAALMVGLPGQLHTAGTGRGCVLVP
jgi:hypothetical protein